MRLIRNKYLQYLLVGAAFLLPVLLRGVPTATVTLAASMVYTAIAGLGINVLLGYSGQISLGHAAFMGLSAYLSAYLTKQLELPFIPKLLKYSKEECDKIVHDMLEMVDMPYDQYAHKYPSEMSGGQQQRIGVLRALAASPPIVLMDEPFGALDPMTRSALQDEILHLQKKLKKTIVFVTHDMEEALNLADVIIFMENGKITQMAPPEEMLKNPANESVKNFLGKHIAVDDPSTLTAADFLRTNVVTVDSKKSLRTCTAQMMRSNVDSLIVTDENDKYIGTVSVEDIKSVSGDDLRVADVLKNDRETFRVDDDAKRCFDKLLSTKDNYVIVLKHDDTVAGIITKTSIAKALAERLWG